MLQIIKKYPQLLLFGMLTAMFSGPGQTFLVSIFIPGMRATFNMSQAKIAFIYSLATVFSACLLPLTGRILDKIHLTKFTLTAGMLLAIGCLVLSRSHGLLMLFLGFLLVRNLGQGTMSMIASTTMAKSFGRMRGKALGIANLGFPLSEAIFPLAISTWIAAYDWRSGWVLLAGLTLLFFSPAVWMLLKKNPHESARIEYAMTHPESIKVSSATEHPDAKLSDVLKDIRFYFLLVPVLIPPTYLTALFFHQGSIALLKGWTVQGMAAGFIAFAISRAVILLFIGPVIDKYSARRIFISSLIPMALGLLCLIEGQHWIWTFFYLSGAGMTMALSMTIGTALWAEIYGTKHLGSIQGFMFFIVVLSTAVAPPVMGWMLDRQWNLEAILGGMIFLIGIGIICTWVGAFFIRKGKPTR